MSERDTPRRRDRSTLAVLRALWDWMLFAVLGLIIAIFMLRYLDRQRGAEPLVWRDPKAFVLLAGALIVGHIAFHLHTARSAVMGFTQVKLVGARGVGAWLSNVPTVLRMLAVAALAVALARPETFRTVIHQEDSVDIMIVFDMSKSMRRPTCNAIGWMRPSGSSASSSARRSTTGSGS